MNFFNELRWIYSKINIWHDRAANHVDITMKESFLWLDEEGYYGVSTAITITVKLVSHFRHKAIWQNEYKVQKNLSNSRFCWIEVMADFLSPTTINCFSGLLNEHDMTVWSHTNDIYNVYLKVIEVMALFMLLFLPGGVKWDPHYPILPFLGHI